MNQTVKQYKLLSTAVAAQKKRDRLSREWALVLAGYVAFLSVCGLGFYALFWA